MNTGTSTTDATLVGRMADGDEQALGALYDRYGGLLFSLAAAIVRSEPDAEEVTADVFAQAWRTAGTFESGRGSVRAWLTTMARTRSIDLVRARGRRRKAHERSAFGDPEGFAAPMASAGPAPDRAAEQNRLRDRMRQALADLSEAQREVVELAYFGGLSQSEIAAELGEPLGTIKTRARTALQKLRAGLGPNPETVR